MPGTNQKQILLRWNDQKVKAGLKPLEAQYHDDDVVLYLALESGRADADLGPNALLSFKAAQSGKTRLAGNFSGGWPVVGQDAPRVREPRLRGSRLKRSSRRERPNPSPARGAFPVSPPNRHTTPG